MRHKRDEAERIIRHLSLEWMLETSFKLAPGHYPSFTAFETWLDEKAYRHYLNFRSQIDPRHEAEGWFEATIRDYWRSRLRP